MGFPTWYDIKYSFDYRFTINKSDIIPLLLLVVLSVKRAPSGMPSWVGMAFTLLMQGEEAGAYKGWWGDWNASWLVELVDVGPYSLYLYCGMLVSMVNSGSIKFCILRDWECMVKNHQKASKHIVLAQSFYIFATNGKSALLGPKWERRRLLE